MTDICFIYLPHPYLKRPDAQLPMGILMLAGMIKRDGRYNVAVKNYSSTTAEEAIAGLEEARIYGITVTSTEIPYAIEFAQKIKEKYPESKVILGGPGTVTPELIDWNIIDGAARGECDLTIFEIIDRILKGERSIYIYCNPPSDLDSLPYPAREMIDGPLGGGVFAYGKHYIGNSSTAILSSRGCPFKCAFCAAPLLTSVMRYRSPDLIVQEMKHVIERYGIRQFRFSDDMLTAKRGRLLELCDKIGPLNVVWRGSIRVKPLDQEMLCAMKEAGCKELSPGFESFDDTVLKILNKKATVKDNIRALEMADKVGLNLRILLMIGTPGQTKKTITANKYYIDNLPHTIVSCTSFVPMPGSDVWYHPDKYGVEILSRDMRDYNVCFFGLEGMNELKPVIKLKDRPLDEFMAESAEFRQWLFEREDVNRG